MTTDLRDKTVEELRDYDPPILGVNEDSFNELARRLTEAEQKIKERDASIAKIIDWSSFWSKQSSPDMTKSEYGYMRAAQEVARMLMSISASAKANAEVLRAAKWLEYVATSKTIDHQEHGDAMHDAIHGIIEAVRAAKEIE